MKFFAPLVSLVFAALLGVAQPATADDWSVSVHGGHHGNHWSVRYDDHDRRAYSNGYSHGHRRGYGAPQYTPNRYGYNGGSRYRDQYRRSYSRRDPWCSSHRVYHVHHRDGSYQQGYHHGYRDGYDNGRNDDYGSASYYDRIEDMAYDTSIYYGRRW